MIGFTRRTQALAPNRDGYLVWSTREERVATEAKKLAVVVCDMWDRNWSRAANERAEPIARGTASILLCGVHANMCILNRTFGIKSFVSRGIDIVLVRDLTDALYNPARSPYVSHEEGTGLVIGYIEKFWCPTVTWAEIGASL